MQNKELLGQLNLRKKPNRFRDTYFFDIPKFTFLQMIDTNGEP
jgi:hypothetical protein